MMRGSKIDEAIRRLVEQDTRESVHMANVLVAVLRNDEAMLSRIVDEVTVSESK